jgi:hypothetical protein
MVGNLIRAFPRPFRNWVNGLPRQAGSWQTDQVRPLQGVIGTFLIESLPSGPFEGLYDTYPRTYPSGGGTQQTVQMRTARLGTNFSGTDAHPANIAVPVILYLGREA